MQIGLKKLLLTYALDKKQYRLWFLSAVLLAAYAFNIKLAVLYNDWNGRFFNALQAVDKESIFRELFYFIGLAAVIIILLVWAGYIKDRLKIAARRDLTNLFFKRWMSANSAHYLLKESGHEPDNPDQRITEDINVLVSYTVNLFVSFYDAMLTIGSFSVILWNLSGSLNVFGINVPGYMFWVCVIYTLIATCLTHLIGKKLKPLNIQAQHMEADLRAALIEKRRHADAIAGAQAETVEVVSLQRRFNALMHVLIALVKKKRDLDLFTVSVGQFTHLAPIFFALPTFLSGGIQLGGLMQIRGAFNDVARSLSWFIMVYDDLAKLAAAYERLNILEKGLSEADATRKSLLDSRQKSFGPLEANFSILIPKGNNQNSLLRLQLSLSPGTLTVINGASGVGKSTVLKALAGFKRIDKGYVASRGFFFWMPQKTYIPVGTLKAALTYPNAENYITDQIACELLVQAQLEQFADKLHESADWSNKLSGGEQQRLCLLRVVVSCPDVVLLDELTNALDEPMAISMLELLRHRLPNTAIVLVTHQNFIKRLADKVILLSGEIKHA